MAKKVSNGLLIILLLAVLVLSQLKFTGAQTSSSSSTSEPLCRVEKQTVTLTEIVRDSALGEYGCVSRAADSMKSNVENNPLNYCPPGTVKATADVMYIDCKVERNSNERKYSNCKVTCPVEITCYICENK